MAGMTTTNTDILIRSELWSNQLKEVLKDNLEATKYVNWIDFPDGNTLTIPSIGDLDATDYVEDTAVEYTPMALGEFQFSITEYKQSATYITNKQRQDSYYSSMLEARFVPEQERAIMVALEGDILEQGQPGTPNGQTANSLNTINGAPHRWVASDTTNSVRAIGIEDFPKAHYALKKANVPMTNLIAIVDPSVAMHLGTLQGLTNFDYNPKWEGVVAEGMTTGMQFRYNIWGFDIYESNYLPVIAAGETINGVASGANAIANLFFSAAPGMEKPWIGSMRQQPKVDSEYNKDFQREEYVTTARWGVKLYRQENFVTVLSQSNVLAYD